MIYGNNRIEEYAPVQAFSVDASNTGIISGGGDDSTIVNEGTTFSWIYDPNNPNQSGFTGAGWFETVSGSPIKESGIALETILQGFADGTRTNLDDVFGAWQAYINDSQETGIVSDFVNILVSNGGAGCWSM